MGELLERRRKETTLRSDDLRARLADADAKYGNVACIYLTGSFGRGEASKHSDLDVFLAADCIGKGESRDSTLSNLNEICMKADLIHATREMKFPDFSGDGEYLVSNTVDQLIHLLGDPKDDELNTFTARLLLLLESRVLIGKSTYTNVLESVVGAYWKDYEDHRDDFMPAFLTNDILRMWRTFCVNYEARTRVKPAREKAKRKLKNYKLKHSRLLTCYSALIYLLAIFSRQGTVHPRDLFAMIGMTPTERIEWMIGEKEFGDAHAALTRIIALYERFLESTDAPEEDLIEKLLDKDTSKKFKESAYEFGDVVFEVMERLGKGTRFHRLLVV